MRGPDVRPDPAGRGVAPAPDRPGAALDRRGNDAEHMASRRARCGVACGSLGKRGRDGRWPRTPHLAFIRPIAAQPGADPPLPERYQKRGPPVIPSGPTRKPGVCLPTPAWRTDACRVAERTADGGPNPRLLVASAAVKLTPHVRRHPHPVRHRAGRPAGRRAAAAAGLRRAAQAGGRSGWPRRSPARRSRPTALVHEAYLRLVGGGPGAGLGRPRALLRRRRRGHAPHPRRDRPPQGTRRSAAAAAGGSTSTRTRPASRPPDDELLALDEALTRLAAARPAGRRAGQAPLLRRPDRSTRRPTPGRLPRRTADAHWAFARAWLRRELRPARRRRPAGE